MRLLKLSPDATRLRRVAKACAAGELSRMQYREARREVIEKFAVAVQNGVEDTVPRFDGDITQKRPDVPVEIIETAARQNRLTWMLLVSVVVAGLMMPLWSMAASEIGAVGERDPNPATSPRYHVDRVQWSSTPALEASLQAEAQAHIEAAMDEIKRQNAPQDHGFSAAELAEVGRFLNAVGVHEHDGTLTSGDLQDLRALIGSQKERRGVSLIQVEQVAAALQSFVRQHGYPLARAFVPSQDVADGEVRLQVMLGTLTGVRVAEGDSALLAARMTELLGAAVQTDAVETNLNALNRARGIHAEASFEPGDENGDTRMVLHVKHQQRVHGSIAFDNYAVKDLGEERVTLAGQWNNPRGVGDVLSARAFTTMGPADHQYGGVSYLTPVLSGRFDALVDVAFADLSLASNVPIDGDGVLFDAQLKDTRVFTRERRREYRYRVGVHDLDWDIVPGQRAWFAGAGVDGHRLWDASKVALSGSMEALVGGVDDERPGQSSTFWRFTARANVWTPVELPWVNVPAKLVVDMRLQATDDLLPATLRMGSTGPFDNKGFTQGTLMLDQGVGVSSALRFDALVGEWWMFLDATYGEQQGSRQRWAELTSVGLGWEGELLQGSTGTLSSRVTLGYPVSHKGTGGMDDEGTQIYWSLRFAR